MWKTHRIVLAIHKKRIKKANEIVKKGKPGTTWSGPSSDRSWKQEKTKRSQVVAEAAKHLIPPRRSADRLCIEEDPPHLSSSLSSFPCKSLKLLYTSWAGLWAFFILSINPTPQLHPAHVSYDEKQAQGHKIKVLIFEEDCDEIFNFSALCLIR